MISTVFKLLRVDLSRAFRSWSLVIGMLGCFLALWFNGVHMWSDTANVEPVSYIQECLFDGFVQLIYVICLAPFAAGYLIDRKNYYLRFLVIRTDADSYSVSKCIAVWLSSAAAAGGGFLLLVVVAYLQFTPHVGSRVGYDGYEALLAQGKDGQYILFRLLLLMAAAGMFAVFGLLVSTALPNIYVVLASPLVFTYFWAFISELLPEHLQIMLVLDGCSDTEHIARELVTSLIILLIMSTIWTICFTARVKRRLRDE